MKTIWDYKVSNEFKANPLINGQRVYDPSKGHTGEDRPAPIGTIITALFTGEVVKLFNQKEMGTVLYIRDTNGNIHVYSHLSENLVFIGNIVKAGDSIAKVGDTGSVVSKDKNGKKISHLHYEIIAQNPENGSENMTRSLAGFVGFNIDPELFLKNLQMEDVSQYVSEWAKGAKERGMQRGLTDGKNPQKAMTREEGWVLADRIIDFLTKK